MSDLKKQLYKLYTVSVLGNLSLTGAWVAILAARGFSLVEIGLAETSYHIAKLLLELPSGVLADVLGRKKTLVLSTLIRIAANLIMIFSGSLLTVCLSIAAHAAADSFCSGSDSALAYDSMKAAGQEKRYDRYESAQMIIYRLCEGISTLCAGLALILGFRIAYAAGIASCAVQTVILLTLKEIRADDAVDKQAAPISKQLADCIRGSARFMLKEKSAFRLMLCNALVGAVDVLLVFFLQARLTDAGIGEKMLGPALFLMQLGGIIGARGILKLKKVSYRAIFAAAAAGVLCGVLLEHTGIAALMTAGGFIAALADDALQVRTNTRLQDMFPSDRRATLISMDSFTFSVVMIVLSPLAGWFFSVW
ncbi:MAG: MFS transporter [Clostridia bacterium]|nr:MFS transporter [Clostridia bacterium]